MSWAWSFFLICICLLWKCFWNRILMFPSKRKYSSVLNRLSSFNLCYYFLFEQDFMQIRSINIFLYIMFTCCSVIRAFKWMGVLAFLLKASSTAWNIRENLWRKGFEFLNEKRSLKGNQSISLIVLAFKIFKLVRYIWRSIVYLGILVNLKLLNFAWIFQI